MKNAPAECRSAIVADEKIEVLCLFYTLIDADYNPNTATSHSSRQRSVMSTNMHTYAYRSLTKKGPRVVHISLCSDNGMGDICNIAAFYRQKAPMFTL